MNVDLFYEAISHCRWKYVLLKYLEELNILDYKNKNFEEIFIMIYNSCQSIKGLGMLTIYDITSGICKYYNINIDNVYIIGNGPKRAIKLLNCKTKIHKINCDIKLYYVIIKDIINCFDIKNIKLPEIIRYCNNGDIIESYLCNWQKHIK